MTVDIDEVVRAAIRDKRLIEFRLQGFRRIAEPHLYGIHKGIRQPLALACSRPTAAAPPAGWTAWLAAMMRAVAVRATLRTGVGALAPARAGGGGWLAGCKAWSTSAVTVDVDEDALGGFGVYGMLPDTNHGPTSGLQLLIGVVVARTIASNLGSPPSFIVGGPGAVLRASVPEAPVDEDGDP